MKKLSLFSLYLIFLSIKTLAQSTTITPQDGIVGQYTNQKISVLTETNVHGFEHTNGIVSLATYIGEGAAWLMTKSNHPLFFSTNNNVNPSAPAMSILTNGNVGIGTNLPAEKLHVVGNARISGLAGNGVKFVRTNANGNLSSTPQTYYYNFPRGSFLSVSGNMIAIDNVNGGIYCSGNTVAYLEAPLNLLDGSVITNVEPYFVDNSNKNIKVELHRRGYSSNTSTILGTFSSSGLAINPAIQNGIINVGNNNIVDNNNYVYYLRVTVTITINNAEGATPWDGNKTTINQIKVTYSY